MPHDIDKTAPQNSLSKKAKDAAVELMKEAGRQGIICTICFFEPVKGEKPGCIYAVSSHQGTLGYVPVRYVANSRADNLEQKEAELEKLANSKSTVH